MNLQFYQANIFHSYAFTRYHSRFKKFYSLDRLLFFFAGNPSKIITLAFKNPSKKLPHVSDK